MLLLSTPPPHVPSGACYGLISPRLCAPMQLHAPSPCPALPPRGTLKKSPALSGLMAPAAVSALSSSSSSVGLPGWRCMPCAGWMGGTVNRVWVVGVSAWGHDAR